MKGVVAGEIATYPFGGVAWDYGQYALGLERLGFEVYYLEDTGTEIYDRATMHWTTDCSYGLEFLQSSLAALSSSLAQRWHYRAADGRTHGIGAQEMETIVGEADVFINISGICVLREQYMPCARKVLIDTDPGWNQFAGFAWADKNPPAPPIHSFRDHDYFFTYAERLGRKGCRVPDLGIAWHTTRPPVILDAWSKGRPNGRWTTVMTWKAYDTVVAHDGVVYGGKEMQFEPVERLPAYAPAAFEVAIAHERGPVEHLRELGWSVIDALDISQTADSYRRYIQDSRGEFSVAKNVYVATGSGWFSCRSVCYLAASRPVVVEDTGFSEDIPTGDGLLAFSDLATAAEAITRAEQEYVHHEEAAREVAQEHFAAELVLADLLDRAGVGGL